MGTLGFIRDNLRWLSAGFLLTFASCFGQTFFISVFAGKIQAAFGLSHGAWGGIYMIGTLGSAVVMIWLGGLTDRFRVRHLGACVLAALALACLFMARNNSLWALPFCIFALRLFGQGMAGHIAAVAMARWYVATRGRALAIASLGYAIGEAVLPITFVALMTWIGWRTSWMIAMGACLALLPLLAMLLKEEHTPNSQSQDNQSAGIGGRHWQRAEVLKHRLFWLILPCLLGPPAFGTAFFFLQVHLAETKGWSHLEMVSLFPLYTTVAVLAMFAAGFLVDRIGSIRLMAFYVLPSAIGFAVFALTDGLGGGALGIIFFGMTSGFQATVPIAFWAEAFGTQHLGKIKALATSIMVFGSAIGPGLTGWAIDQGMIFEQQMIWISGYMIIACILAYFGTRHLARTTQIDIVSP